MQYTPNSPASSTEAGERESETHGGHGGPRPVIVKFCHWKEKERVLTAARRYYKENREKAGSVSEDFSLGTCGR